MKAILPLPLVKLFTAACWATLRLSANDGASVAANDSDGISENVAHLMGLQPGERALVLSRPESPRTAFFLAQPYEPSLAVPADAVQLYAGLESTAPAAGLGQASASTATTTSWVREGYRAQLFLHSRYGADIRHVPAEDQTDRQGRALSVIGTFKGDRQVDLAVGPLTPELTAAMQKKHGSSVTLKRIDRYMIPTRERIEFAKRYYQQALTDDVTGFCFDEPEIWANAGYSDSFKAEWFAHYGTAWDPPHGSVDARYQAEQLKALLVHRWVESILNDVSERRPSTTRLLALHSQPGYAGMGMGAPHHRLLSIPVLNEVIAEVWNEPFDSCYLQYSSFHHLTRGTDKKLWLMMDPWGDSPAMSLDYYRRNYGNNVLAALMFPTVERYQPLIWPNRLYGKIPQEYETLINTVAGALGELWRYPDGQVGAGSRGFATFVSDSMAWQRAEPEPSDFDGFQGLAAPLVQCGLPVDVLSLDRAAKPGYLDEAQCLLLSYDFLKPTAGAQNHALAEWTRRGGTLVCFGGTDAYNAVRLAWWRQAGHASPLEELFSQLGLPVDHPKVLKEPGQNLVLEPEPAVLGPAANKLNILIGPSPGEVQYQRRVAFWQSEENAPEPSGTYPLTIYSPPPGATPIYRIEGDRTVVAWQMQAGRGHVVFVGLAPGYFQTAKDGAASLRLLARYGYELTGSTYREGHCFLMRRGPYTGIRTLDRLHRLDGRYIDLFSPTLNLCEDPEIPPQTNAFFIDAPSPSDEPVVSGRLEAFYASPDRTSFVVQAPSQTDGAARIAIGGRQMKTVHAFRKNGHPVAVQAQAERDTMLLTYSNDAAGVVVRVDWH